MTEKSRSRLVHIQLIPSLPPRYFSRHWPTSVRILMFSRKGLRHNWISTRSPLLDLMSFVSTRNSYPVMNNGCTSGLCSFFSISVRKETGSLGAHHGVVPSAISLLRLHREWLEKLGIVILYVVRSLGFGIAYFHGLVEYFFGERRGRQQIGGLRKLGAGGWDREGSLRCSDSLGRWSRRGH